MTMGTRVALENARARITSLAVRTSI
jgi:hypothetical protein